MGNRKSKLKYNTLSKAIQSLPLNTKLRLLSSGYARNIMQKCKKMPLVLTNECASFIGGNHEIIFQKWKHHQTNLLLEIKLKSLDAIATLLTYIDITKYEIKYIETREKDFNSENNAIINTFITTNIYDCNCLSFTGYKEIFMNGGNEWCIVKIIAYDKNENIICESEWKEFNLNNLDFKTCGSYDAVKLNELFSGIDINNRGYVNVDEWVKNVHKVVTVRSVKNIWEDDMDKIFFYWICHMFKRDNKDNTITANDLGRAVTVYDIYEYQDCYFQVIQAFHYKIRWGYGVL